MLLGAWLFSCLNRQDVKKDENATDKTDIKKFICL
jgi:hypothetical protein